MTYECLKKWMSSEEGKLGILQTIMAGGFAGITNWIVGMPPDVLKSRLQSGIYCIFFSILIYYLINY